MPFHATLATNLDSILKDGLIPQIGENSKDCGETVERIYFFINKEELINGVLNWFGEIYDEHDEDEELSFIYIEVDDSQVDFMTDSEGYLFFECTSSVRIPSHEFLGIYNEEFKRIA